MPLEIPVRTVMFTNLGPSKPDTGIDEQLMPLNVSIDVANQNLISAIETLKTLNTKFINLAKKKSLVK